MKKGKSRIIGLAVLLAFLLGANPETMAKDIKVEPTLSDTVNIRRGFKADQYKKCTGYELEHFGFLGGEFSRVKRIYEFVNCCKPTGNEMDGCSAKEMCPKYSKR